MRKVLSDRARALPYSGIRKIFDLSATMADVIHLEAGEPDLTTPAHIREAAKAAIDAGVTHYTSSSGVPELRKAIAEKLQRENSLAYDPSTEIIVTAGANTALTLALFALTDENCAVLVPDPGWANYEPAVRLAGAVPVWYPLHESRKFRPDIAELERLVTERTKAILLNSPSNPTGAVFSTDDLHQIADFSRKHDLMIISDDVYEKIVYDKLQTETFAHISDMKERTILINAFSKTYAMTGWRLGYAAASPEIVTTMIKLHSCMNSCASSVSQAAGIAALNGPQDSVGEMVDEFQRRRDYFVDALNEIDGFHCVKPQGAFYAFVNVSEINSSSEEVALDLLKKIGVASVPGSAFGGHGEGYIRFSYAASMNSLESAINRMKEYRSN